MKVVVALGGNALLERGEPPDSNIQEWHVTRAVSALAPLLVQHQLIITHGNGPQVGVLALESASDPALSHPYPFDVLGAQTQGMIGYWLVQALHAAAPGTPAACVICRTLVKADDPAFASPTKFVGPVYDETSAKRLAAERGWDVRQDGQAWRRVVPSPEPAELIELGPIKLLIGSGVTVVCAGGGGVPVVADGAGGLHGVEAVVDKDLTAALLARELGADALLLLTDVEAVLEGYGTPQARPIRATTARDLRARPFAAGSMGPKVEAACRFAEATGGTAAIGRLGDACALLDGTAGTIISAVEGRRRTLHPPTGVHQDLRRRHRIM
jgi:carbamate kinase